MATSDSTVVTRFPPSPTGNFHIGSARTALFNYLYARQHGGTFLVRFEDTDKERSKKEFEDNIIAGMEWLGLDWDGDIERQTARADSHRVALDRLLETERAYIGESSKHGGNVIRFKNPNTIVTFDDMIRGEVSFDTTDLGDFVIARGAGDALYHLAVVVDDFDQGVTHVIRGEDHLSNTPRQILLQEALGYSRPLYAHIPLILAPDRSKLSKRHGAVSIDEYRKIGYVSEAVVNFLALLGWHPQDDQEIFSLDELVSVFSLERVQKGGAMFDVQKLNSLNRHYLKQMQPKTLLSAFTQLKLIPDRIKKMPQYTEEMFVELLPSIIERADTLQDAAIHMENGEFDFAFSAPNISTELIIWKDTGADETKKHLEAMVPMLNAISDDCWNAGKIKEAVWQYADSEGRGEVLWPLRTSLTGLQQSPDPFTVATLLGKEDTIQRIKKAVALFS